MNEPFFASAGLLQFRIAFGDPEANLATVRDLLQRLEPRKNTVIALPELWSSGFDYARAEAHAGQTPFLLEELQGLAAQSEIILAGSLLEEDKGVLHNTLYFVGPAGVLGRYRKQHLFGLWDEDSHFAPGSYFAPVATSLGLLGGQICYDLRFPEDMRQQAFNGAQLMVVSAEWPEVRIDHWQALVRARAIENQVFVVACNSCGQTGEHVLGGYSMIVGPDGTVLGSAGNREEVLAVELDPSVMQNVRARFCPAGQRPRPENSSRKTVSLDQLLGELANIRKQKGRVAFTNGCFDILHSGHVSYLEQARNTGDCLVVGLNSDRSVRAIKGESRPINPEHDRARVLSALACVDYVVMFDEETPLELIRAVRPDTLVKGADWPEDKIVGGPEVKAAGGKIVRIPFEHQVSTSEVIGRIRGQN